MFAVQTSITKGEKNKMDVKSIRKDMDERMKAYTDSRQPTDDEVTICWLLTEIEAMTSMSTSIIRHFYLYPKRWGLDSSEDLIYPEATCREFKSHKVLVTHDLRVVGVFPIDYKQGEHTKVAVNELSKIKG
jgi:hypothetical protein